MKAELNFYQWMWKKYRISGKDIEKMDLSTQEVYQIEYDTERGE